MDYYVPPTVESAICASTNEIAETGFRKEADLAQYGGSDYKNAIRVERGISLDKAFEIAISDPNIHYFCFTKGHCMILEVPSDQQIDSVSDPLHLVSNITYHRDVDGSLGSGGCRVFHHGDVVFFGKEGKWLGTAPGLSDTYSKNE